MEPTINNKIRPVFPPATVMAGYVFIVVGLFVLTTNFFIGILLVVGGIYLSFATYWVQIDPDLKMLRQCTDVFGLKFGNWQSYQAYPNIAILHRRETSMAHSRSNRTAITSSDVYYDLFLLGPTHRKKIRIDRKRNKTAANERLAELSEMLNVKPTVYQPTKNIKTKKAK